MQFKKPKNNARYYWTEHVCQKMMQYGISEQTVKRIIRSPERTEKGIAPNTAAVMQSRGKKQKYELWAMYQKKGRGERKKVKGTEEKIIIITAWRYPGVSPVRDVIPIPEDIMNEIENLL